jgi:hypothetical protein
MPVSLVCSRCGFVNSEGSRFCHKCGIALLTTPAPFPGFPGSHSGQPGTALDYATWAAAQQKVREVDRTKTGLLLLMIGIILGPIPYLQYIGGILVIVGAILVVVGRNAFGRDHSRNVVWSVIIYVIGIVIVIAGTIGFVITVFSASINAGSGGSLNSATFAQSLASSFEGLIILAAVGGAIAGLAEVLFTYALQEQTGKILLWMGYVASLVVSAIVLATIFPLIDKAATQSVAGFSYNSTPFSDLQSQLQLLQLLGFIPAILFASAIYMVWSRIDRGQLP